MTNFKVLACVLSITMLSMCSAQSTSEMAKLSIQLMYPDRSTKLSALKEVVRLTKLPGESNEKAKLAKRGLQAGILHGGYQDAVECGNYLLGLDSIPGPEKVSIRFELAQAYGLAGDLTRAKATFETLRSEGWSQLSTSQKAGVQEWLGHIQAEKEAENRTFSDFSLNRLLQVVKGPLNRQSLQSFSSLIQVWQGHARSLDKPQVKVECNRMKQLLLQNAHHSFAADILLETSAPQYGMHADSIPTQELAILQKELPRGANGARVNYLLGLSLLYNGKNVDALPYFEKAANAPRTSDWRTHSASAMRALVLLAASRGDLKTRDHWNRRLQSEYSGTPTATFEKGQLADTLTVTPDSVPKASGEYKHGTTQVAGIGGTLVAVGIGLLAVKRFRR